MTALQAEWALWGKQATDREYRLLRCSSGMLRPRDFIAQIDRYSPGTLGFRSVPQVSVGWFRNPAAGTPHHVGLAIHETVDDAPRGGRGLARFDAAGRDITYVRYFCVPYKDLAAHVIDYQQLYGALRS